MILYEYKGYHFTSNICTTKDGRNLFLVVKMRNRSTVMTPRISSWEYTEDEYVSFIRENQIPCAMLILDDFSMLSRIPEIQMLELLPSFQAPNHVSYEPVYEMPNLRMINPRTIYGEDDRKWTEFDCGRLESAGKVEYFSANCRKGIKNINALSNLKSLLLSGYNASDLHDVVGSDTLDTISILMGKMESLNGIEQTNALKVLQIQDCYGLSDISALSNAGASLQGLVLENCRKIRDYSVLGELRELRRLSLIGTGSVSSLSFIEKLPKLETLLLTMNVDDGDLSVCDRIHTVRIWPNRRHFNRKAENFPKRGLDEITRGDENVEDWRRRVI